MVKTRTHQTTNSYKNFLLPSSKPFTSQTFYYKEKENTPQELIFKKLKKITEFLEDLHPNLTNKLSGKIQGDIKRNLETLLKDVDFMKNEWHKNPFAFNTNELKINQHCINEMKNICDHLQKVKLYEHESKKFSKIKHVLHELDQILQASPVERRMEEVPVIGLSKSSVSEKKQRILTAAVEKTKKAPVMVSKIKKSIPKKLAQPKKEAKPKEKLPVKHKKVVKAKALAKPKFKSVVKTSVALVKKPAVKKEAKPKAKLPVKHKKVVKAKALAKPKFKSVVKTSAALVKKPAVKKEAKPKAKLPVKHEKVVKAKALAKPKSKSVVKTAALVKKPAVKKAAKSKAKVTPKHGRILAAKSKSKRPVRKVTKPKKGILNFFGL